MELENELDFEMRDRLAAPEEIDANPWLKTWGFRVALLAVLIGLAGMVYYQFRDYLSLEYLATQENALRDLQAQHPIALYTVVFLIYTLLLAVGVPLCALLTIICGWLFGFIPAILLASFGSTTAGALNFVGCRYFFRNWVERTLGNTLDKFNEQLEESAAFYLFITRLIPQIPFVLVNLLMGLSPISFKTFWWVSQLAMLPALLVFVWIGTTLPNLKTISEEGMSSVLSWQLMLSLAATGLIPLAIRFALNGYQKQAEKKKANQQ
ncbi:TVP38/TMEM64 family protein [Bremerella cremea]|uniref:TVP38/TMEM64 family membrane protein n=1 Tax=Bremerella cremea TaxID=1031537 RepID=A0A368KPW5_9BACT|nr:TVP38/TMEM64 family protein [Bremerella cremea]RCS43924.1 TVP38/TMEM64 family protein [Bremerella cremea]